jgi:P4 family phage/plasmid primase-like protien
MAEKSYQESADFLADIFGVTTEQAVELRSFTNHSGDGPARPLFTRDMEMIAAHCSRWDGEGRGMFFGVCTRITGSHTGRRVDLAECPSLWADIDTAKLGLDKDRVVAALRPLPFPPSVIIDSGGGLHAYWLLNEAIDVTADGPDAESTEAAITSALKQLAGICAGDLNVCDLARVMRLPGTMNTKPEVMAANGGAPAGCGVIEATWARHEFDDLVEWLDWQRPAVERPDVDTDGAPTAQDDNPYLAAARRLGFKPPLDVAQALAAMRYLGEGDASIHQTQLRVSASLGSQDIDEDEIVAVLLDATHAAAGHHGATWNWRREEAAIRRMIVSARAKFGDRDQDKGQDRIVSLAKVRENRAAGNATPASNANTAQTDPTLKAREAHLIAQVGEAAIAHWSDHRGTLMLTQGQAWTYSDGFWRVFDEELDHLMRITIQGVVRAMGQNTSPQLLNATWRYVMEHPGLLREGIKWDAAGVIVCRNGVIDPRTRKIRSHSEADYATGRVEADIDSAATAPIWAGFLEKAFSNVEGDGRQAMIDALAEWFGSALVRGKNREMTKGLIAYGPSRTGKTQLAQVLRALIGGRATGMRARDLEEHFGMQPLIRASAWIADDAVSSGEFLDAERYKVIVTGEPVSIPRKNKDNWEGSLDIAVCLTANHLPRVKDQSHAVYNRSIVLPMTVEHDETAAEEKSISERVIEVELGGVLNWALEGFARLAKRRYFDPPRVMRDAVGLFEHDNNPIGAWLAGAVEASNGMMVDRRDLLASLNGWMISEFGQDARPYGGRTVFPAIRRAMPGIGDHQIANRRYVTGIKLNDEGIGHIHDFADNNYGKQAGSGEADNFVNRSFQDPNVIRSRDKEPRF